MKIPFSLALTLAGFSGFIALSYEILWARAFSFTAASRPVAFGLMLGSYLFGLAVGSLVSRRWQDRYADRAAAFQILSRLFVASNLLALLVMPLMSWAVVFTHWAVSLPLVVLGATLLGSILPLLCHTAISPDDNAGSRTSYIYIANIIGSGAGSLLTGFILFEHLSITVIPSVLLIVALALGLTLALFTRRTRADYVLWTVAALLLVLSPWLHRHLFERLQFRDAYFSTPPFERIVETRHGVITIDRDKVIYGGGIYDGKIETDPFLGGGLVRPYFISALHAAPRDILVIGLSGGAWTQILAHHPQCERITVVEINPGYLEVIAAYPEVSSLLNNPKVEIVIDDGRRWLRRNPHRRFDVVVMNTSFHWREFASALLGVEFLELVKSRLAPRGIVMWNCTGSLRAEATGASVFPHTIMVSNHCVASTSPIEINVDRWRAALSLYQIDDKSVFDATLLESFLAQGGADSPTRIWHPRDERRHASQVPITDDNLGEEYAFQLGVSVFLRKLTP